MDVDSMDDTEETTGTAQPRTPFLLPLVAGVVALVCLVGSVSALNPATAR